MDLVVLSDTHELHRDVEVPGGDLLLFCGDLSMFSKSLSAIRDFNEWLGELPHRWKLVVPGNHKFFIEENPCKRSILSHARVLIDEEIIIGGLKIYGSPMTPLSGGAFGKSSPLDRKRHWAKIPEDIDVLVTHGPPHGILDRSPGQTEHIGDQELSARLKYLPSLRLHCFGHVHGGYGSHEQGGVLFINAALLGPMGDIAHHPVALRISPKGTSRATRKTRSTKD
jgi:Icc-related predicted phosphoesterase